ncbi:hypothetical protein DSO57_1004939 [Entomophthora muscae]|uniref:Uncharacterized protein n=1 Tax=Entomophthora muscae TaxID=34485 RepID=A0ACC2T7W2_9FUNG|nr:hypothetical protein DSO57_1004939 [Entomophthora muscae]
MGQYGYEVSEPLELFTLILVNPYTVTSSLPGLYDILSLNGSTVFAQLSGLTFFFPWKPRPKSGIQTPALILCGPPALRIDGPAACILLRLNPPQAEAKDDFPKAKASQTKEIIVSNGRAITAPNGGTDLATISFMNLKSTPATNQELTQERGTGPWPGLMTTKLKQDNQVANSRILINERTPGSGAILLPLNLSTQISQAHPFQCPDEPSMENTKFEVQDFLALLPADFHPPGVPFDHVHFTEYQLKPEYKDYTLKKVLELYLLAPIK